VDVWWAKGLHDIAFVKSAHLRIIIVHHCNSVAATGNMSRAVAFFRPKVLFNWLRGFLLDRLISVDTTCGSLRTDYSNASDYESPYAAIRDSDRDCGGADRHLMCVRIEFARAYLPATEAGNRCKLQHR
jgi:hypothetical protein